MTGQRRQRKQGPPEARTVRIRGRRSLGPSYRSIVIEPGPFSLMNLLSRVAFLVWVVNRFDDVTRRYMEHHIFKRHASLSLQGLVLLGIPRDCLHRPKIARRVPIVLGINCELHPRAR